MIHRACIAVLAVCLASTQAADGSSNSGLPLVTSPADGRSLTVWRLEGTQPDSGFGWVFDGGGDLNGDGYDDLIVGEGGFETEPGHRVGRVQVFLGSPSGFGPVPDQVLLGEVHDAGFGSWVALLGDVNGDGYADAGITSNSIRGGPFPQGRITIHHGSAAGLSSRANWSFDGDGNLKEVWYVGAAGDVNRDGFADAVIGARDPVGTPPYAGVIFVFDGATTGLAREPSWSRRGTQAGELYGTPARRAGDVNHDGFGDLIVGTAHHDGREENDGLVELFFGGPTGLAVAPGWFATHTPRPHPRIAAGRNQLFGVTVDGVGDVNGDGISDIMAAGSYVSNGEENEGRVFVWHGSRNGPGGAFDWSAESDQPQALFGHSVAGVGDVDGDGFADVLIAAMHMDWGELNEGLVALYHGSARGLSRWPEWSAEGSEPMAAFGSQVVALGDVNRDGLADFAVGSSRHRKEGRVVGEIRVYFGQRGGLGGSTGWNRRISMWRRLARTVEAGLVQTGWRLVLGVALAGAIGGGVAVWMLGSYRAARGRMIRLRRRVEDLAATQPGVGAGDVERWQQLAMELRRSLDPIPGDAHRLADLIARTTSWAAHFAATRGFALNLDVPKPELCQGSLDAPMAQALDVFVRVTLANVAEHAQAARAVLRLSPAAEQIVLEVCDDGCGFDHAILDDPTRAIRGRLGLGALHTRIARLGGQFEVRSERGRGTNVRASLPRRRPAYSVWYRKRGKATS